MIGKTISHYKILEKLGEGGMGVVYKAEDTKLDRFVALKFLPLNLQADEEEKQRFIHEAKTASALDHPNVCTIYEIDESEDGQIFIAMAYYEGELLKDKIDKGPLKLEEALNFATRIAEGLERAHEAEIIHRDIKPANIMVTDRGEVKILDFGLAKLAGQTKLTKAGTTLGTIAYMSPEQTRGEEVDHHSDLFSFGAVLYEMLTGQHPFKGDYEMAVMYAIMNENAEPLTAVRSGVPMSLEQVVNKALEKDKELRYQTASDLLADLKKVTKELESGERVTTSKQVSELKKPGKFKRVWIPMVAVLVLLTGLVVLWPLFKEEPLVSDPKPIAVVPFENKTGDENLDYLKEVIPNLLITNLEQSRYLNLMTWERMQDLLSISGKKDLQVSDIDKDIGFELCRMDGIQAIVLGSFTKAGDLFATDIKVLDVDTKMLLLSTNAKGAGVGSILDSQIDELTKAISRRVIEPFAKFSGQNLIVKDVTTNSMEAYRFYRRGVWDYNKFFQASSIANLKRATQLDRSFAMAYYYLARVYFQLQNIAAGKSALREAEAQSDKTTEREQLYIEMDYAKLVEENVEKAIKLNEELVEKFPKEKEAFYFLAVKYRDIGKNAEAIQLCKQALTLDPNWGKVHNELGYRYVVQGEYEQAEKSLRKYAALTAEQPNAFDSLGELFFVMGRLDDAVLNFELAWEVSQDFWLGTLVQLGYIYTIRGNFDEALRQSDKFFTLNLIPEYKCIGYWNKARLYFHLGRYEDAIVILNQQASISDSAGIALREAQAHELMSFIHAERRNFTEAENELQTCLKLRLRTRPGTSRLWRLSYQCFSSLWDIRQGKLDNAREKFKAANEMLPQVNHRNKEMYVYWLALLQGEIALAEGNPKNAIGKFNEVILPNPYFLAYGNVYHYRLPVAKDGLARAYETAGLLDDAIAEYQRLSTFDAGSKERFLINPKYHHRLAKLYEEKGQSELAIKELQKFLDIWKEADEDLPELIDAKARLARLKEMSIK